MVYKEDSNNNDVEIESFNDLEEHESEKAKESPRFITRVRLLVLKKFTITKDEKEGYKYSIC